MPVIVLSHADQRDFWVHGLKEGIAGAVATPMMCDLQDIAGEDIRPLIFCKQRPLSRFR